MWTVLLVVALAPVVQTPADAPAAAAPVAPDAPPAITAPAPQAAPTESAEIADDGPPWPLIIAGAIVGGVVVVGTGAFMIWALVAGANAASDAVNTACGNFIGGICAATCIGPVDSVGKSCTGGVDACNSGFDSCASTSDACSGTATSCDPGSSCDTGSCGTALASAQRGPLSRMSSSTQPVPPSAPSAMAY